MDKSLAQEYRIACSSTMTDRVALLDRRSLHHLRRTRSHVGQPGAEPVWKLGLKPLDRVVVQLPNVAEFVVLYLALQKIGCIPIAALMPHRFAEISQFVELSGATACVVPDQQGRFRLLRHGRAHPRKNSRRCTTASFWARAPQAFCRFPN